jgi:hypothetical protein
MITRRHVITGAFTASGLMGQSVPASAGGRGDDNTPILTDILSELRASRMPDRFPGAREVDLVRQSRRLYLKQTGRFPEAIDVGFGVWEHVIDWYISTGQPLEVSRLASGNYYVRFLGTNIVLKADLPEDYVGQGTDR